MPAQQFEQKSIIQIKMDDGNTFTLPYYGVLNIGDFMANWKTGEYLIDATTGTVVAYKHFVWARLAMVTVDVTPQEKPTAQ